MKRWISPTPQKKAPKERAKNSSSQRPPQRKETCPPPAAPVTIFVTVPPVTILVTAAPAAIQAPVAIHASAAPPPPPPPTAAPTQKQVVAEFPATKPPTTKCDWKFLSYKPSEYETKWAARIKDVQDHVCSSVQSEFAALNQAYIAELWKCTPHTPYDQRADCPPSKPDEYNRAAFSSMFYQSMCGGENKTIETFLEPIAGVLRHPNICPDGSKTVDKNYMVVDPYLVSQVTGKLYFFDVGASTWNQGAGGASQSWFDAVYNFECWRHIDEMYLWEGTQVSAKQLWNDVPRPLRPHYHYYMSLASTEPENFNNPLTMLRNVATPDDYVIIKIDIDAPSIEDAFIHQILNDVELSRLIDELYFEHHVHMDPMIDRGWGHGPTLKQEVSLQLFSALRRLGIRAHSWV